MPSVADKKRNKRNARKGKANNKKSGRNEKVEKNSSTLTAADKKAYYAAQYGGVYEVVSAVDVDVDFSLNYGRGGIEPLDDDPAVLALRDSILAHGLEQNLVTMTRNKKGEGRIVIVGFHRAKALGLGTKEPLLESVPTLHFPTKLPREVVEGLQIDENAKRKTANAAIEAKVFKKQFDKLVAKGLTEDVAIRKVAKLRNTSPAVVAARLRLLDFPKVVRDAVEEGTLSADAALHFVDPDSGEPLSDARAKKVFDDHLEGNEGEAPTSADVLTALNSYYQSQASSKDEGASDSDGGTASHLEKVAGQHLIARNRKQRDDMALCLCAWLWKQFAYAWANIFADGSGDDEEVIPEVHQIVGALNLHYWSVGDAAMQTQEKHKQHGYGSKAGKVPKKAGWIELCVAIAEDLVHGAFMAFCPKGYDQKTGKNIVREFIYGGPKPDENKSFLPLVEDEKGRLVATQHVDTDNNVFEPYDLMMYMIASEDFQVALYKVADITGEYDSLPEIEDVDWAEVAAAVEAAEDEDEEEGEDADE